MTSKQHNPDTQFLSGSASQVLLAFNAGLAVAYFAVIAFFFPHASRILFGVLIAGEVFHLWQVLTFLYTVWDMRSIKPPRRTRATPILAADVFITVAGEPVELVEATALAAKNMRYPVFNVYLLNDGYVAGKDNWREIEEMAARLGVGCITRTMQGGAKAGNINNALAETYAPLVAVFDADHVPHPDFLSKTAAYFADPHVGFVQSPQYYKNYDENLVTRGAWQQQQLFFGPICRGKNRLNAVTMAGTNMVIRRSALDEVGGLCTESIAEDFVTGMLLHSRGWRSVYVPEVLAEGLAPEDFLSYSKQQYRWARGALDVIFRYNVLFRRGLTLGQRIQYLSSASFFLSGTVILMNALMPLVFFYTGLMPFTVSGMLLASIFLPYMFVTLYALALTSNFTLTWNAVAFSMSAFPIHIKALWSAALGTKASFQITPKQKVRGTFTRLVTPHFAYIAAAVGGIGVATVREGLAPSVANNIAWALLNCAVFVPFISAAMEGRRAPAAEQQRVPVLETSALERAPAKNTTPLPGTAQVT